MSIQNEFNITFPPETHFDAFFQSAVLALVTMVLVNRAVSVSPTLILQVPTH